MKNLRSLLAASAITLLLGAAPVLLAGPGAQYWNRNTTAPKPAPTPATVACNPSAACSHCMMGCAACVAPTTNQSKG